MTRWMLCAVLASGCADAHVVGSTRDAGLGDGSLDDALRGFGEPCTTDADCTDGLTCATTVRGTDPACPSPIVFPGGYCTHIGSSDSGEACPGELLGVLIGTCDPSLPTINICLAHCAADADCRTSEGYHCEGAFSGEGGCLAD